MRRHDPMAGLVCDSQAVNDRIRELAERYAATVWELTDEVAMLTARGDEQIRTMGASWR